jgi:choline dehydrogenase-like flavoprotein
LITDIAELSEDLILQADVCIIGAGAAGLLIARELVGTQLQVVLLESGGIAAEDDTQALSHGDVSELAFRGLTSGRSRVLGGTTTLWGGQCIPLDPIDFAERPWVPFSGWPIDDQVLSPFYEEAKDRLGVAADEYERPVWDRFGLDPLSLDPAKLRVVHGVFIRQPNLGRRYRAELEAASNLRLLLHANALRIRTGPYGTEVRDVEFTSLNGRKGRVEARRVLLCTGAIENARLLLLSDQVDPNGIGNGRDLVGRFLHDHPCGNSAVIETDRPSALQDRFNLLYGRRANYLPKLALSEDAQRREEVLNCVGRLAYEYEEESAMQALRTFRAAAKERRWPDKPSAALGQLAKGTPRLAVDTWRVMARGLSPAPRPRRIYLEAFSEQTPSPDSRVFLSEGRDALGLRKICINWQLDPLTWRTFSVFATSVRDEFARLGLGTVTLADWAQPGASPGAQVVDSYHPAGTTRMGQSFADGVVDTNCQVFGVDGLYVIGASVFPTSGAANPVLTISALALRAAARLKSELAGTGVGPAIGPARVAETQAAHGA